MRQPASWLGQGASPETLRRRPFPAHRKYVGVKSGLNIDLFSNAQILKSLLGARRSQGEKASQALPMNDAYNLHRFLTAQESVYDTVVAELRAGRKSSHWIWFIFPQIAGLGHSAMAQQFAIASLDEAKAYLQHSVLGQRLRECTQLVLAVNGRRGDPQLSRPSEIPVLHDLASDGCPRQHHLQQRPAHILRRQTRPTDPRHPGTAIVLGQIARHLATLSPFRQLLDFAPSGA